MPVVLFSLGQLNTPLVLKEHHRLKKLVQSWEVRNYENDSEREKGRIQWQRETKKKDRDMEELFKISTIMLILRSNLKYERKSHQKSHQWRLPLNAKSTLKLFSSALIQPLLEYFQRQEAHYQLRQFMNSLNNALGIVPGTKCYAVVHCVLARLPTP